MEMRPALEHDWRTSVRPYTASMSGALPCAPTRSVMSYRLARLRADLAHKDVIRRPVWG